MSTDGWARVLSVAAPIFASIEENRRFGEACAEANVASGRKVAVLASGATNTLARRKFSVPILLVRQRPDRLRMSFELTPCASSASAAPAARHSAS